jgi:hypothetical protein
VAARSHAKGAATTLLYTQVRWRGGSRVHHDDKVTAWAWYGNVCAGYGGLASSRAAARSARVARGARGVGEEGGAVQGGPTARGPADQGRPRRTGREGNAAGARATWRDGALWTPRAKNRSD